MNRLDRMKELISILNHASQVYYQGHDEIMSDFEYDKLYDELCGLEASTGVVLSGSPTTKVGYEVMGELPKENHGYPVLSLDKTKEVAELRSWLGEHEGVISWKLDGLTVVVTYENGRMVKAVTRGNGIVGEVITNNARTFVNLPLTIPYGGRIVIRGEALIKYSDFEKINAEIDNPEDRYKNPRNLCSGSVRQLNNEITAKRHVYMLVYNILDSDRVFTLKSEELEWLAELGFDVVGHDVVNNDTIEAVVHSYSEQIKNNDFPSDGLVLTYNNIEYGESLGRTAKFPRHSIAFKWEDETALTTLTDIEWSASRTGLINPVAIFEPVELEGTTVSRASVHNLSIVEELGLGIGDEIKVYKANMIIPQIAENLTKSGKLTIPDRCPVCGSNTVIRQDNGVKALVCPNDDCTAKQLKYFAHFVSRDAVNIDGLSESTIAKFISACIINEPASFYHLKEHEEEITGMEGMGPKSFANLINAVEASRATEPANYIYSLGINGIGLSNARAICKYYGNDIGQILNAKEDELVKIDGIGNVLAHEFCKYMADPVKRRMAENILAELNIIKPDTSDTEQTMDNITVVITGSLNHFSSRSELKKLIEDMGGRVTGSVTGNTGYLINNDINSLSSKNKKAKELGVEIITEQDFIDRFNINI